MGGKNPKACACMGAMFTGERGYVWSKGASVVSRVFRLIAHDMARYVLALPVKHLYVFAIPYYRIVAIYMLTFTNRSDVW